MRIGLVVEASQIASKEKMVERELQAICERYGHTLYNYSTRDGGFGRVGMLNAILLNAQAVDFTIVGCGTGVGVSISCNAFPNVQCGLVSDATQARLFREFNMGNSVAVPFSLGFGVGGEVNLSFLFDKLFCPQEPLYSTPESQKMSIYFYDEWTALKKQIHPGMLDILKRMDPDYLRKMIDSPTFREQFFVQCKDHEIASYLSKVLK